MSVGGAVPSCAALPPVLPRNPCRRRSADGASRVARRAAAGCGDCEVSICLFLFPFYYAHINSLDLLALLLWQEESDVLWRKQGDAQRTERACAAGPRFTFWRGPVRQAIYRYASVYVYIFFIVHVLTASSPFPVPLVGEGRRNVGSGVCCRDKPCARSWRGRQRGGLARRTPEQPSDASAPPLPPEPVPPLPLPVFERRHSWRRIKLDTGVHGRQSLLSPKV